MAKSKAKKSARSKSGKTDIDGPSIIEDEFGNYRIKAGRLNGNYIARAFAKASSNSQGLMAEAGGASEHEAIEALKALLAERESERAAARRWDDRSGISVPTQEEFVDALRQTNLSESQRAMLKAHAMAGTDGLTIVSLMNAGGYRSKQTAIKIFTRAGALVADFLGTKISEDRETGAVDAASILRFRQQGAEDAPALWVMHEELRHAVRETF